MPNAKKNLPQKLEALGQLASGIAHEINTPTQYIGDNLQFLQKSFDGLIAAHKEIKKIIVEQLDANSPEYKTIERLENKHQLDFITEEIPHALDQSLEGIDRVNGILQAMKQFTYASSSDKKIVQINQLIEHSLTVSRNEWKYHCAIERDLDPKLPQEMLFHNEISQVILNLVVNAVHAVEEKRDKDSSYTKGIIKVASSFDEHNLHFSIADDGIGISKELREKIFEPFFTTKEIGKGTGQGLSLVHSIIVQQHNGSIDLDSEPNKGTRFSITIPRSPKKS